MKFADSCFPASCHYPGLSNVKKLGWTRKPSCPLWTLYKVTLMKFLSLEWKPLLGTLGSLRALTVLKTSSTHCIEVLPALTLSQHHGSFKLHYVRAAAARGRSDHVISALVQALILA